MNNVPMATLEALRQAVDQLKPLDPVVLQIEREGKLMYLTLTE
jgi:S1-C subfamily serine protease